jgi:nicotinamidase/pyrazinamidase
MSNRNTALIVVDAQKDFMPGGALPVPGGDEIVPVVNELLKQYHVRAFSMDTHPYGHVSFASRWDKDVLDKVVTQYGMDQILWPDHCIFGTPGWALHEGIKYTGGDIITKGFSPEFDSYSAFRDDGGGDTSLPGILYERFIDDLVICGLATDYCVKATVLDAINPERSAFANIKVVLDACRGVNPETTKEAIKEMEDAGAVMVQSKDILGG